MSRGNPGGYDAAFPIYQRPFKRGMEVSFSRRVEVDVVLGVVSVGGVIPVRSLSNGN